MLPLDNRLQRTPWPGQAAELASGGLSSVLANLQIGVEKGMVEIQRAHIDDCTVYHLPGRDWFYLLGPQNSQAENLVFGLAEFPAGTLAAAHAHQTQEEIIYILSGEGAMIAGEKETRLEPGVAVFIPPGLLHQIRVDGGETLKLVTVFSPPVTPGAYDPVKDR